MAADFDLGAFSTPHQRNIIKHGTTHHAFTGVAVSLIVRAVEAETRMPPAAMKQMTDWVNKAVSAIDENYFNSAIKTKTEQMDDALNSIANKALSLFT